MADSALNRYLMQGTSTQRAAYTPSPATVGSGQPLGIWFFETDTGKTYGWSQVSNTWQQIVGGSLPSISALNVLANNTTGTTTPVGISVSALLDLVTGGIGTAPQGDILYRGASGWSLLAPGTSGQVLQTGGASANPSWATPAGGGGAMALISSITSTGVSNIMTFSSIPNTYNSLKLVFNGSTQGASNTTEQLFMNMNGDTGSNYYWSYIQSTGATTSAAQGASQTAAYPGQVTAATTAGYASMFEMVIPAYANTSFHKQSWTKYHANYGNSSGSINSGETFNTWFSTAAINSISFKVTTHNFTSGSQAWLYGIT